EAARGHAPGAPVEVFIRPEHVRLSAVEGAGAPCVVREASFLGALTRLKLALGGDDKLTLWADLPGAAAEAFKPGARAFASWEAGAPHVLAKDGGAP
ncbi:MAG: TOBE domain-containing protein, partial [Hyphomicrobiales bacterium]|nr:TOBE domain-containing protein [Hyphomicrobiales bacterium]